jgi:hypothetical protein
VSNTNLRPALGDTNHPTPMFDSLTFSYIALRFGRSSGEIQKLSNMSNIYKHGT